MSGKDFTRCEQCGDVSHNEEGPQCGCLSNEDVLREENERLRLALCEILHVDDDYCKCRSCKIVRQALKETT
jgi:hypothetical protein